MTALRVQKWEKNKKGLHKCEDFTESVHCFFPEELTLKNTSVSKSKNSF